MGIELAEVNFVINMKYGELRAAVNRSTRILKEIEELEAKREHIVREDNCNED